jgi:hypothetical protein
MKYHLFIKHFLLKITMLLGPNVLRCTVLLCLTDIVAVGLWCLFCCFFENLSVLFISFKVLWFSACSSVCCVHFIQLQFVLQLKLSCVCFMYFDPSVSWKGNSLMTIPELIWVYLQHSVYVTCLLPDNYDSCSSGVLFRQTGLSFIYLLLLLLLPMLRIPTQKTMAGECCNVGCIHFRALSPWQLLKVLLLCGLF